MSELIDVLALLPDGTTSFLVVAPAVAPYSVDMKPPLNYSRGDFLTSAGGYNVFSPGDNFNLLSAGFALPESFILANSPINSLQQSPSFNLIARIYGPPHDFTAGLPASPILGQIYTNTVTGGSYIRGHQYLCTQVLPVVTWSDIYSGQLLTAFFNNTLGLPVTPAPDQKYVAYTTAFGWIANHVYNYFGGIWSDITTYTYDPVTETTGLYPLGGLIFDYFLPNFNYSGLQFPLENYDNPLGIEIDIYNLRSIWNNPAYPIYPFRTQKFMLKGLLHGLDENNSKYPQISMIGVPAALNSVQEHVTVFCKILHNTPLA